MIAEQSMTASEFLNAMGHKKKEYSKGAPGVLKLLAGHGIKPNNMMPFGRGVMITVDKAQAMELIKRKNQQSLLEDKEDNHGVHIPSPIKNAIYSITNHLQSLDHGISEDIAQIDSRIRRIEEKIDVLLTLWK